MAQKFELETSCSQHFLAYKKHSQGPAFVWIEFTDKVHSSFLLLVNKTAKKKKVVAECASFVGFLFYSHLVRALEEKKHTRGRRGKRMKEKRMIRKEEQEEKKI